MNCWDLDCLQCLIGSYESEHDWDLDEDTLATWEMIDAAKKILAELRPLHPRCERCGYEDATVEGLCRHCAGEVAPSMAAEEIRRWRESRAIQPGQFDPGKLPDLPL